MFKSDEELQKELPPELYQIARQKGTEPAFSGQYVHTKDAGMYTCAVCSAELFSSSAKFDSGTGWPSFDEPANRANIELKTDDSHGMHRTEVVCKNCGSHLGHVFDDGPTASGQRYCINSVCLNLKKQ